MKSVQVCTRGGGGGSKVGDFTAYVLYGCPLKIMDKNVKKMIGLKTVMKSSVKSL